MPRVGTAAHLLIPRRFLGSGWAVLICRLHWRWSRGDLKSAVSMATVAGDLCLAPRILTVRGAVIATFWRKAFASRMRAFLRVRHGRQTGNPRSNLRMRTVKARVSLSAGRHRRLPHKPAGDRTLHRGTGRAGLSYRYRRRYISAFLITPCT